jgi:ATP-dependent DNA helicase RecQ
VKTRRSARRTRKPEHERNLNRKPAPRRRARERDKASGARATAYGAAPNAPLFWIPLAALTRIAPTAAPAEPLPSRPAPAPEPAPAPAAVRTGVRIGRLPPRTNPRKLPTSEDFTRLEALAQTLDVSPLCSERKRAITAVMEGRDAALMLPSGFGRAACWLLGSQLFDQPTLVLCVRPRILLELQAKLQHKRIASVRIDESLSAAALEAALSRVRSGGSLVVLATPRAAAASGLVSALAAPGVALVAVEDAEVACPASHEVSPAALGLGALLDRLGRPPTLAVFGASSPEVRHDAGRALGLRRPAVINGPVVRDEIVLDAVEARGETRLRELVALVEPLRRPGIVFCSSAEEVDVIYGALRERRLPVHRFHGAMAAGERAGEQLNFLLPGRRSIMIATSAFGATGGLVGVGEAATLDRTPEHFGLGLDKRDLRFVIHSAPPPSLEQYLREVALVGRDGQEGLSVVFHDPDDRVRQEIRLDSLRVSPRQVALLVRALELSAVDGRPRTLEALAIGSGLNRRSAETVARVLEDAGAVELDGGWVRATRGGPLGAPGDFTAIASRVTVALERLRNEDARRLEAIWALLSGGGCLRAGVARHFGELGGPSCGRCNACVGRPAPSARSNETIGQRRYPPAERVSITRRANAAPMEAARAAR